MRGFLFLVGEKAEEPLLFLRFFRNDGEALFFENHVEFCVDEAHGLFKVVEPLSQSFLEFGLTGIVFVRGFRKKFLRGDDFVMNRLAGGFKARFFGVVGKPPARFGVLIRFADFKKRRSLLQQGPNNAGNPKGP